MKYRCHVWAGARGLTVPLTSAALIANTAQNNILEQSLFPVV